MADSQSSAIVAGERVWLPNAKTSFSLATVRAVDPANDTFQLTNGTVVARGNAYPVNPTSMDAVPDNTMLMYLHEPSLLHNLRVRYERDEIYTTTGYILIAINPYKRLPIYDNDVIFQYSGAPYNSLKPHVYSTADRAYRCMKAASQKATHGDVDPSRPVNQSIVVSGESGAGKTETCKYMMRFYAVVGSSGSMAGIEQRVIDSVPLLEAFGNAKTVRNNNSSRFGKFTEVHFDSKQRMAGAAIETYLLERPRIVQQAQNERNFHIFYQLLAGAESSLLSKLDLTRDALHYTYLNSSKCVAVDGIDDRTDFTDVSTALNTIGMSRAEHEDLFGIVASLLHLGNVLFDKPRRDEGAAAIASSSLSSLAAAALRLGINRDELADKLVRRTMKMRGGRGGDSVKIPLSRSDAQIARDALAQFVYGTTFNFLVSRINQALPCRDSASFIGILDISGFEIFEHNSFEQLCINYANEKIQECFNMQMLLQEQEIYELEGLRWRKVDFQDNRGIIDLVEERHRGILAILDEECRVPKATDLTFGAKVHATHVGCSFLTKPKVGKSQRRLSPEEGFIINHFAGTVLYETKGFLEKNNATLHDDLLGTLRKTENESMQRILQHHQEITKISTSGNEKRFKSIGGRFNDQLSLLMTRLASTQSHFVRCIKPNQLQRPGVFVEPDILVQLRYSGMCAVLVLMQKGFPTRCTFEDIYQRYHHNFPAKFFDRLSRGTFCEAILVALDLHGGKDFQIGLTKVFFKAGKMKLLDDLANASKESIDVVVKKVKKWLAQKRFRAAGVAVIATNKLARRMRGIRAAYRFRQMVRVVRVGWVLFAVRLLKRARRKIEERRQKEMLLAQDQREKLERERLARLTEEQRAREEEEKRLRAHEEEIQRQIAEAEELARVREEAKVAAVRKQLEMEFARKQDEARALEESRRAQLEQKIRDEEAKRVEELRAEMEQLTRGVSEEEVAQIEQATRDAVEQECAAREERKLREQTEQFETEFAKREAAVRREERRALDDMENTWQQKMATERQRLADLEKQHLLELQTKMTSDWTTRESNLRGEERKRLDETRARLEERLNEERERLLAHSSKKEQELVAQLEALRASSTNSDQKTRKLAKQLKAAERAAEEAKFKFEDQEVALKREAQRVEALQAEVRDANAAVEERQEKLMRELGREREARSRIDETLRELRERVEKEAKEKSELGSSVVDLQARLRDEIEARKRWEHKAQTLQAQVDSITADAETTASQVRELESRLRRERDETQLIKEELVETKGQLEMARSETSNASDQTRAFQRQLDDARKTLESELATAAADKRQALELAESRLQTERAAREQFEAEQSTAQQQARQLQRQAVAKAEDAELALENAVRDANEKEKAAERRIAGLTAELDDLKAQRETQKAELEEARQCEAKWLREYTSTNAQLETLRGEMEGTQVASSAISEQLREQLVSTTAKMTDAVSRAADLEVQLRIAQDSGERKLAQASERAEDLETQLAAARKDLNGAMGRVTTLRESVASLEDELAQESSLVERSQRMVDELTASGAEEKRLLEQAHKDIENLEAALAATKAEAAELQSGLVGNHEQVLQSVRSERDAVLAEHRDLKEQLARATAEFVDLTSRFEASATRATSDAEEAAANIADLERQRRELEMLVAKEKQCHVEDAAAAEEHERALKEKLAELEQGLADAQAEQQSTTAREETLTQRLSAVETAAKTTEESLEAVRAELQQARRDHAQEIEALEEANARLQQESEQAKESAEALQVQMDSSKEQLMVDFEEERERWRQQTERHENESRVLRAEADGRSAEMLERMAVFDANNRQMMDETNAQLEAAVKRLQEERASTRSLQDECDGLRQKLERQRQYCETAEAQVASLRETMNNERTVREAERNKSRLAVSASVASATSAVAASSLHAATAAREVLEERLAIQREHNRDLDRRQVELVRRNEAAQNTIRLCKNEISRLETKLKEEKAAAETIRLALDTEVREKDVLRAKVAERSQQLRTPSPRKKRFGRSRTPGDNENGSGSDDNGLPKLGELYRCSQCLAMDKDPMGRTPMHFAAAEGNVELLHRQLAQGGMVVATAQMRDGTTPLIEAAVRGHDACVNVLLKFGVDVDTATHDGSTALTRAAGSSEAKTSTLKLLLDATANVDTQTKAGATPLHRACEAGNLSFVTLLLEWSAELELTNDQGWTPAYTSVFYGNRECLVELLDHKASVNQSDSQDTPMLHRAAASGNCEIAKLLLQHHAATAAVDAQGNTALHVAVERGHTDMARLLLEEGDVPVNAINADGETPLHSACTSGIPALPLLLLGNGADVDARSGEGRTPLHYAASDGHDEIVRLLVRDFGADVESHANNGWTPLHCAADEGKDTCVEVLLKDCCAMVGAHAESSVMPAMADGATALHLAAAGGHIGCVARLVDGGASVNARSRRTGATPLHEAARTGQSDTCALLLDRHSSITTLADNHETSAHFAAMGGSTQVLELFDAAYCRATDKVGSSGSLHWWDSPDRLKHTPLLYAAANGHARAVIWLLRHGANVNARNNVDDTVVHLAAGSNSVETMQALLSAGASADQLNVHHQSPLHFACATENGSPEIVALLLNQNVPLALADEQGTTALHLAAASGHTNSIKVLLAPNVEQPLLREEMVLARDRAGLSPLDRAIESGHEDVVLELLRAHSDPNQHADDGCFPLHRAAALGHVEIARMLLRTHAEVNARASAAGETALHCAAECGELEMLELLLSNQADVSIMDLQGHTARDLAALENHTECVALLDRAADEEHSNGEQQQQVRRLGSVDGTATPEMTRRLSQKDVNANREGGLIRKLSGSGKSVTEAPVPLRPTYDASVARLDAQLKSIKEGKGGPVQAVGPAGGVWADLVDVLGSPPAEQVVSHFKRVRFTIEDEGAAESSPLSLPAQGTRLVMTTDSDDDTPESRHLPSKSGGRADDDDEMVYSDDEYDDDEDEDEEIVAALDFDHDNGASSSRRRAGGRRRDRANKASVAEAAALSRTLEAEMLLDSTQAALRQCRNEAVLEQLIEARDSARVKFINETIEYVELADSPSTRARAEQVERLMDTLRSVLHNLPDGGELPLSPRHGRGGVGRSILGGDGRVRVMMGSTTAAASNDVATPHTGGGRGGGARSVETASGADRFVSPATLRAGRSRLAIVTTASPMAGVTPGVQPRQADKLRQYMAKGALTLDELHSSGAAPTESSGYGSPTQMLDAPMMDKVLMRDVLRAAMDEYNSWKEEADVEIADKRAARQKIQKQLSEAFRVASMRLVSGGTGASPAPSPAFGESMSGSGEVIAQSSNRRADIEELQRRLADSIDVERRAVRTVSGSHRFPARQLLLAAHEVLAACELESQQFAQRWAEVDRLRTRLDDIIQHCGELSDPSPTLDALHEAQTALDEVKTVLYREQTEYKIAKRGRNEKLKVHAERQYRAAAANVLEAAKREEREWVRLCTLARTHYPELLVRNATLARVAELGIEGLLKSGRDLMQYENRRLLYRSSESSMHAAEYDGMDCLLLEFPLDGTDSSWTRVQARVGAMRPLFDHPCILGVEAIFRDADQGLAYVQQPGLADKLTLDVWLEGERARQQQRHGSGMAMPVKGVLAGILQALEHMHRYDYVHGNVSPGVIYVSNDNDGEAQPLVTGLRLEHDMSGAPPLLSAQHRGSRGAAMVAVTPPECHLQERSTATKHSDMYQFGALLFLAAFGSTLPAPSPSAEPVVPFHPDTDLVALITDLLARKTIARPSAEEALVHGFFK